jgi:hypothetical protein
MPAHRPDRHTRLTRKHDLPHKHHSPLNINEGAPPPPHPRMREAQPGRPTKKHLQIADATTPWRLQIEGK